MGDHSDDEEDLGYVLPTGPSELSQLTEDELAALYRKIAFANLHPASPMIEHEMRFRLVQALQAFKEAADRSSRTLNILTAVLVVLTAVLVIYTIRVG